VFPVAARVALAGAASLSLLTGCGGSPTAAVPPVVLASVPAPPGGAHVMKVLTVVEENHSLEQMQASMPYLTSLARQYAYATSYTAVSHPSLPNYLALSGGSTFGVTDDAGPVAHPISGPSVFGQALAVGKTAKVYAESMPTNCALSNSGSYAVKHAVWAYYVNERAACQSGQVPMGDPAAGVLASDIATGNLPNLGWAIPDLNHDAHDGTLAQADHWLAGWLPKVLSGPDFRSGKLAVVITGDESDAGSGNKVLTVVAVPGLSSQVTTAPLTHYSLTGLYSDIVRAPRLRGAGSAASFAATFGLPVSR